MLTAIPFAGRLVRDISGTVDAFIVFDGLTRARTS